jgi:hypothetical protein
VTVETVDPKASSLTAKGPQDAQGSMETRFLSTALVMMQVSMNRRSLSSGRRSVEINTE